MDHSKIVSAFRDNGKVSIKEGNGNVITFIKPELWTEEKGENWVFLLFDLFQIRTLCQQFSEVSLDIVEYSSKPTIYHSPANAIGKHGPIKDGVLQFSLILEPNWNKLLFQISQPVLVQVHAKEQALFETKLLFPLLSPGCKELYLGTEGEIKIIKG